MTVAVLFVRRNSVYKKLTDVDAWDEKRNARTWPGGSPLIAHPPCAQWGTLRHLSHDNPQVKRLALLAVNLVRIWGGVLEHPKRSTLWPVAGLPEPGEFDGFGGWTMPLSQKWFGHRAEKETLLYIVGCLPRDLPPFPILLHEATHTVAKSHCSYGVKHRAKRKELSKAGREATPILFARWLVEVARRCARE